MSFFASLQALNQRLLYTDRMTVSRQTPVRDEYGGDDYQKRDLWEDVPCRLSQKRQSEMTVTEGTAPYEQRLKVFTGSEIDVMVNDVLTVTHEGQVYILRAGLPFLYPTHQEIPVTLEEDA